MSIGTDLLPEFTQEMAGTRKTLERFPEDKLDWKVHPKSNTLGWVVAHLAEIPGWVEGMFAQDVWDIHPVGSEPYKSPVVTSKDQILGLFDANAASATATLNTASDEATGQSWSLLYGGKVLMTMPRLAVVRRFVINHTIHHRAFLCVYLRLNGVEVPGLYDPSGDDSG